MNELEMRDRLAKLEQSHADHLSNCERRYQSLQRTLDCIRKQISNLDGLIEGRAWTIARSLVGFLFLLLLALLSYIWLDHTEHQHFEVYKNEFRGAAPSSKSSIPSLLGERGGSYR